MCCGPAPLHVVKAIESQGFCVYMLLTECVTLSVTLSGAQQAGLWTAGRLCHFRSTRYEPGP